MTHGSGPASSPAELAGSPTDESWAAMARASRAALAAMGKHGPDCLPDERDACGGTFAQHAMAHLVALQEICAHELDEHLGENFAPLAALVRERARAEVEAACRLRR